jgi:hypothetical protein
MLKAMRRQQQLFSHNEVNDNSSHPDSPRTGGLPPANARAERPPFDELPVLLALERVPASGDWGAVRIRDVLVYSSGLLIEIEELRVRTTESKDDWCSAEDEINHAPSLATVQSVDGGSLGSMIDARAGHAHGTRSVRATFREFWVRGPFDSGDLSFKYMPAVTKVLTVFFSVRGSDVCLAQTRIRQISPGAQG